MLHFMIRAANETDARTGAAVRHENRGARRIERSIPRAPI